MSEVLWRISALTAFILVLFWAGTAGMMTADRAIPVRVATTLLLTPEVPAGGMLRVEYAVIRDRACRTNVERQIIDSKGTRFILPETDFESMGPTGPDRYISPNTVPVMAELGDARYRVTLNYSCNIIHRLFWPITDVRPDLHFNILPAKD